MTEANEFALDMPYPLRLILSPQGRAKLAVAARHWPDIPMRVCEAYEDEAYNLVYSKLPSALPQARDVGHRQTYERVFQMLLGSLTEQQAEGVFEPDIEGLSLLIATALIALTLEPFAPAPKPTGTVAIPSDWSDDSFFDTAAMYSVNLFGEESDFTRRLLRALYTTVTGEQALETRAERADESERMESAIADPMNDIIQDTMLKGHYAVGGPSPELIGEIIRTGAIPDGTLPNSISAAQIRAVWEENLARFTIGANLDAYGRWLREQAGGKDGLMDSLSGRMLRIQQPLIPVLWPPDTSTALAFTDTHRRDQWVREVHAHLQTLDERHKQRRRRGRKRMGTELNSTIRDAEGTELGEITSDPDAVSPEEQAIEAIDRSPDDYSSLAEDDHYGTSQKSVEALLDGMLVLSSEDRKRLDALFEPLSKREAQVAKLLCDGFDQKTIAERLRVSTARVSHLVASLRRKCKWQPPD